MENTENPRSQAIKLCLGKQVTTPLMLSVKKIQHFALKLKKKREEESLAIHYGGVTNILYYSSLKQTKMK